MAIRKVLRMGEPGLMQRADEVSELDTEELGTLIRDMKDTMAAYDGAGLAASQIGIGKRVVIFGIEANPRYPQAEAVPMTVLVNPEIEILGDELQASWEGCLSVPGMRGLVPRYAHIRYRGVDPKGNPIEREVTGFHAIVVQHECDHLDGILYPMRMPDMSKFGFVEELIAESSLIASETPCEDEPF